MSRIEKSIETEIRLVVAGAGGGGWVGGRRDGGTGSNCLMGTTGSPFGVMKLFSN